VTARLALGAGPLANGLRDLARFSGLLKRLRPYLRPQLRPLAIAVLASLGYTLVTLLEPWPLQIVFDGILLGRPIKLLGTDLSPLASASPLALLAGAALAVLLLALLRGQFYFTQNVRAALAGLDVVMAIRRELFHHLQALSLEFHRRARTGDLLMRLTGDIVMLREMVVATLVGLLTQVLVVLGILIIMAHLNVRLTLIALLVTPVLFGLLSVFRVRLRAAARQQRQREGRLAAASHEVLQSVHLVQAYTAEKHEDERFRALNKRTASSGARVARIEAQFNRAVEIALAAGICATLWLGAQDVLAERLTPGELLVFLAYMRSLYRPLRQASKMTQRMAKASACGDRVIEVLELVPTVQDLPGAVSLHDVRGHVAIRNVTFAYGDQDPILRDVSLEAAPGEMVALVGPTGAGKTSLLSLISRFYDPQAGEILIDGMPIRRVRLKSLRRQISILPQETVVFGVSVRENIAYGAVGRKHRAVDPAEIEHAARRARAHEFITQLPQGYDTVISERGTTLSGGQRQRIAIARAMIRKAPILLLDEPTTGLDPIAAADVLEALERLMRDRTTLVVAHQMSTVLRANRIVFLEGGRVVEEGTHEELFDRGGRYAQFVLSEWGGLARRAGRPEGGLALPAEHPVRGTLP